MKLSPPTSRSPVLRSCTPRSIPMHGTEAAIGERALTRRAELMNQQIAERTLPFWFDYSFRGSQHGYRVGYDPIRRAASHASTLCVAQARLTWAFSRAHRLGYSSVARDYLLAARHGQTCLKQSFLDPVHGGYFWRADKNGPIDPAKVMYGQSFILYALVEFGHAAGHEESIDDALTLFRLLNQSARGSPSTAPAALELCDRTFGAMPIDEGEHYLGIAAPGYRCANTALHWMEALTELLRATGDIEVRATLEESLALNSTIFYPEHLDDAVYYHPAHVNTSPWPNRIPTSHGHNVEFGWLMMEAQDALGVPLDWRRLESIVAYTLRNGFDRHRGGVFNAGHPGAPGFDSGKSWWPQAEFIAALSYVMAAGENANRHPRELSLLLDWYLGPQMHQPTGTPYFEVDSAGVPLVSTLSADWQAAYHDLRARWIFIDAVRSASEIERAAGAEVPA